MLNNFSISIFDILLLTLAAFLGYALLIIGISGIKNVDMKKAKEMFWQDFWNLGSFFAAEVQLGQGDIFDILSVVAKFSSIQFENTKWTVNNFSPIPNLRVEILDSDFQNHFDVIENNIRNIFGRIFAYNSTDGLVNVTYERTLQKNVFHVVVSWAATRKSKKALQQQIQSAAAYNRQTDIEKSSPFIDRELEKEMEDFEDGRKN